MWKKIKVKVELTNSKWEKHKRFFDKYEAIIYWIFISFILVIFLDKMGTLFSGYHLVDDHNYISINKGISENGLMTQLLISMQKDFGIRFRPLWTFLRVLDTYFFMDRYGILSLKNALVISTAVSLLFYYSRKKGVSRICASLFGFFIIFGNQAAVLWRLGPQEPVGLLLFSLALVATDLLSNRKNIFRSSFFVCILILLTLQKESFLVCVPGFFLLLFSSFLEENEKNGENISFFKLVKKFIVKYKMEIIFCVTLLVIEAYFITTKVGLNSIGYAGFDTENGISYYIKGILNILQKRFLPYVFFIFAFSLFLQQIWEKKDFTKANLIEILFPLYIIGIQLVVYAKSGMSERYLIPAVIGVGYIAIILGYKYLHRNKRLFFAYLQLVLIFLLYRGWDIPAQARDFTLRGQNFEEIVSDVLNNVDRDATILLCSEKANQEIDYSFAAYLEYYYGYENYIFLNEEEDKVEAIQGADLLFGIAGSTESKLRLEGIDKTLYRVHPTTHYEIAVKEVED